MRVCTGNGRNLEFCDKHAPTEAEAKRLYGAGFDRDYGENRFAYDPEHPPYDDGETFQCCVCHKKLVYGRSSGLAAVLNPPAADEAIATW